MKKPKEYCIHCRNFCGTELGTMEAGCSEKNMQHIYYLAIILKHTLVTIGIQCGQSSEDKARKTLKRWQHTINQHLNFGKYFHIQSNTVFTISYVEPPGQYLFLFNLESCVVVM